MNIRSISVLVLAVVIYGSTSASVINYTYDPAGRVVSADYGSSKSASYAYDNAGNLLQSSTPSPGLVIGPIQNGQFSIAWPSTPGGFVLESTTALGPGAVWSPVVAPTNQMGDRFFVTLSVGSAQTFYRLHK
ncbi:MAG: RHS repeat protein [Verrucomicrobiota bacterium]|nr:RHS repeat protein [Verrucomicrobiota bacterium]